MKPEHKKISDDLRDNTWEILTNGEDIYGMLVITVKNILGSHITYAMRDKLEIRIKG